VNQSAGKTALNFCIDLNRLSFYLACKIDLLTAQTVRRHRTQGGAVVITHLLQILNKADAAYLQSGHTNRLCTLRTQEIKH